MRHSDYFAYYTTQSNIVLKGIMKWPYNKSKIITCYLIKIGTERYIGQLFQLSNYFDKNDMLLYVQYFVLQEKGKRCLTPCVSRDKNNFVAVHL